MINKIDLHGIKHQEVQRKLDSFLGKHMMGNKDYVTIVTGNSKKMRDIVNKVLEDYGLVGEPMFLNEGSIKVKLK